MSLNRKLLIQIGRVFDITNQITLRTKEYTDAKEKLDSDGLHILKYLQKRTVDQNYNQKRQSKQHEEDTAIPDIASDRDNKIDETIKEDRDVETIDHFETGDDHKLDEAIDE